MRKHGCVLILGLSLAACGGGGGGSSVSNQGALMPTTATASDGQSRQVRATCGFSQALGPARGDNLRIERVSWVQTVELNADTGTTRLIAGKPVLVRVDLLANAVAAAPASAYLLVSSASNSCTRINLSGPGSVPTARDPQTLSSAFSASIPATLIQPGVSVSVVFDDARGRTTTEADKTYRVYDLPVHSALTETIRVIPLTYRGQNGFVSNTDDLAALMTRLHPVSRFNLHLSALHSSRSSSRCFTHLLLGLQCVFSTFG